jgi:hypothetical protein
MRHWLLLVLTLAACGGAAGERPGSAVDGYVELLRGGDYGRAYDMMSARYKKEHSREDFIRMMKESPTEVRETAARLGSKNRKVDVSARLVSGDLLDEVLLVQEDGQWRIASDPLSFYPQDTPGHALRSFLRAVDLKRWDVVLRFVPNEYRKHMTDANVKDEFEGKNREENATMRRILKGHLDNHIEQQGDSARMPFGDRYEVRFRREDGVWKIEDPY